jgi:hypothetical protein
MKTRLCAFAVLSGLFAATAAPGAEPLSAQFQQFAMRPDNRQAVIQVLQTQWNQIVGVACPSIKPADWQVTIYQPVQFGADGKPLTGAWKEIVTSEGCGFRKIFNVASVINADGSVKRIGLLPGTSHADMLLERDAIVQARTAAIAILPKDCKQTLIVDTAFIAQEGKPAPATVPGRDAHPWREEWTLKACDATAIVTLHFVPDATGTGINAAVNETRRG